MEIIFKSPREHYTADACIVWCFDDRFTKALGEFVRVCGFRNFDLVKIAGGAKSLASPDEESERDFVLNQIQKSIKLHHTKLVVLMNHAECGAYGEKQTAREDLQKAKEYLQAKLPGIEIKTVFADFEKISEI